MTNLHETHGIPSRHAHPEKMRKNRITKSHSMTMMTRKWKWEVSAKKDTQKCGGEDRRTNVKHMIAEGQPLVARDNENRKDLYLQCKSQGHHRVSGHEDRQQSRLIANHATTGANKKSHVEQDW